MSRLLDAAPKKRGVELLKFGCTKVEHQKPHRDNEKNYVSVSVGQPGYHPHVYFCESSIAFAKGYEQNFIKNCDECEDEGCSDCEMPDDDPKLIKIDPEDALLELEIPPGWTPSHRSVYHTKYEMGFFFDFEMRLGICPTAYFVWSHRLPINISNMFASTIVTKDGQEIDFTTTFGHGPIAGDSHLKCHACCAEDLQPEIVEFGLQNDISMFGNLDDAMKWLKNDVETNVAEQTCRTWCYFHKRNIKPSYSDKYPYYEYKTTEL